MTRKPIFLTRVDADASPTADDATRDHASLREHFSGLSAALNGAYRQRHGGAPAPEDAIGLLGLLDGFLDLMQELDRAHGPDGVLPLVDADRAIDDALRATAALENWLSRLDLSARQPALDTLALGIGLWAMRHDCAINVPEPLVNALARQANRAETRQDVAAAYGLMQGLIAHLEPRLGADLERSNPERPWRLLLLNLAITGLRSGDEALVRHAFQTLNAGLPDERTGFYEEALGLATQACLPESVTALIRQELAATSARH